MFLTFELAKCWKSVYCWCNSRDKVLQKLLRKWRCLSKLSSPKPNPNLKRLCLGLERRYQVMFAIYLLLSLGWLYSVRFGEFRCYCSFGLVTVSQILLFVKKRMQKITKRKLVWIFFSGFSGSRCLKPLRPLDNDKSHFSLYKKMI